MEGYNEVATFGVDSNIERGRLVFAVVDGHVLVLGNRLLPDPRVPLYALFFQVRKCELILPTSFLA